MPLWRSISGFPWTFRGTQISFQRSKKLKVAAMSSLDEQGQPPAVFSDFDALGGVPDCLGGAGLYTTYNSCYTFLSAVLRRDTKLLTPKSYEELFRPQLKDEVEEAFNHYLYSSPERSIFPVSRSS